METTIEENKEKSSSFNEEFNCGKIEHIYEIVNNLYTGKILNEKKKLALQYGTRSVKINGRNGALERIKLENIDNYDLGICIGNWVYIFLARYDDKKNKFNDGLSIKSGYRKLFNGVNPEKYRNHHYYMEYWYKPKDFNNLKDCEKYIAELYLQLQNYDIHYLDSLFGNNKHISVEYVGINFQKTLGYTNNHFVPHNQLIITTPGSLLHTIQFNELKETICNYMIEGIIIEYNGERFKIRQNCFTKEGVFDRYSKIWIKQWKDNNEDMRKLYDTMRNKIIEKGINDEYFDFI